MGASWEEEPRTAVGTVTTLEEAAICWGFGSMSMVKILEKIEKSLEFYEFWESLRALDAGVIKDDEQSKWIDYWKTQVFYRPFNGWDMRHISQAQSEPDTQTTRGLRPHLEASIVIFAFREPRLNGNQESRLCSNQEPCFYGNLEPRLYNNWELHLNSTWTP